MRTAVIFAIVVAAQSAAAQVVPTYVTTPLLTIGDSAGEPAFVFNRLTDAKRLSDGRIVAAICGQSELRSFDVSGKYLGGLTLAQPPMQRSLFRLFVAGGDTLGAYEALNTRLTLVAPDLRVLRTITVPNPDTSTFNGRPRPSRLDVLGRLADGSFVGRIHANPTPGAGVHRRAMSLYRFNDAGVISDSVSVPGLEAIAVPGQPMMRSVRLGRGTSVAIFGDRIVLGDQTAPLLVEYGPDFKPARRVQTNTTPIPITDSIKGAWTRTAMDRRNFPMNGVTPVWGDAFAEGTPAFGDLVAGTDGRIWVQDPLGPDYYPLVWRAYLNGGSVAQVELPPRFYPTQFGPDWVLGLAYDESPIDRLQLLGLKPGTLTNARLVPRESAPANRPRCGAWTSR